MKLIELTGNLAKGKKEKTKSKWDEGKTKEKKPNRRVSKDQKKRPAAKKR